MPVQLSVDSTVKLARFALSVVNGSISKERVERRRVLLSTQYTRERQGGLTQVTIIAIVQRGHAEGDSAASIVELSAWAVDQLETPRTQTLSGRRIPTLSSNAPIGSSAQLQPYLVTPSKSPMEWLKLEEVLTALIAITPRPPKWRPQQTTATGVSGGRGLTEIPR